MSDTIIYGNTEIRFGALSSAGLEELLTEKYGEAKKIIITDENVFDLWIGNIIGQFTALANAEIIQLPAGEENKTIDICMHVWQALSEYEIGRNDLIINIGGGVISDMGGFIASTYKRGISFINIPTTLLSQVDASVGGKTGVDLGPYKNQIGVFSNPSHIFIDHHFLTTLAKDQILSGYAEMLKHGLIADKILWEDLKSIDPRERSVLLPFIRRCVELKKNIVEDDPKELGVRKILNFGHTVGHAIEGYFLNQGSPLLHGFAVAWGMIIEAHLSAITKTEKSDIKEVLSSTFGHPELTAEAIDAILVLMKNDKKNHNGSVRFSLLKEIGKCSWNNEIEEDLIRTALEEVATV